MSHTKVYEIAEIVFSLETEHLYTHQICTEYLSEKVPLFHIKTTEEDIALECERSDRERMIEGLAPFKFDDEYLESLAVLRKLSEKLVEYDAVLFHGSALSLDNDGYVFTAKSGTGKSTHTAFWRKTFANRCVMINDDKPFIKLKRDGAYVFGSPWNGKHNIGTNSCAKLKAICLLDRGINNTVSKIEKKSAFPLLLQQAYRIPDANKVSRLIALVDKISSDVELYSITCNLSDNTAIDIYNGMKELTK